MWGTWFGLAAPKGTPGAAIDWLYAAVGKVVASPQTKERFAQLGASPFSIAPEEMGRLMQAEARRWTEVIKSAQIKPERC